MLHAFDKSSVDRIARVVRAYERRPLTQPARIEPPRGSVWSGRIRVGGRLWISTDITGTSANLGLAKIYFDGTTPPAWATKAEYDANPWPSDYIIVRLADVQGDFILPRG